MNLYTALATLAFGLIFVGSAQYKRRAVHVPLVLAGIAIDLALVLILEFQRDVIGMTFEGGWSWMQWTHIGSSVVAVLLYFPATWLGLTILRGKAVKTTRRNHRNVAIAALVFRTVGFGFMWAV